MAKVSCAMQLRESKQRIYGAKNKYKMNINYVVPKYSTLLIPKVSIGNYSE
jgi:hypothetical protein